MRLITYTDNNLYVRHSLMRLSGMTHIDIRALNDYINGETQLSFKEAQAIMQADKCISFIEGIKKYKMKIDTDDYIVTLVTLYTHNMMEETVLKSDFPKEAAKLQRILEENIKNDLPVFSAAHKVLEFVTYCNLVKNHTLAAVFLIANLMIVQSGYLLVLEDTDSVSPDMLLGIEMIVAENA